MGMTFFMNLLGESVIDLKLINQSITKYLPSETADPVYSICLNN